MSYRDDFRSAEKDAGWTMWRVVKWSIILILIFTLLGGVIGILKVVTAPARGAAGVIEQTFDADNILYNYEFFRDAYNQVLAMDANYESARVAADTYKEIAGQMSLLEQREFVRLDTIARGIRMAQNNLIAEYNSNSGQANREAFRNPFNLGDEVPDNIALR